MPAPELILHHDPDSPFAEKIRLVLGFKKLACNAVQVPAVTPRPDVVALTGGYRRTPVLQIGADIYCDSSLICDVLEHVQPEPPLYPPHLRGCTRVFAEWADTTLFGAAMAYNAQPRGAAQLSEGAAAAAQAFLDARRALHGNGTSLRIGDATSAYRSYLRRVASMVEEHDFLFGAEPCVADFATYHPLWFTRQRVPALADILSATPAVSEWMDRLAALGHGRMEPLGSQDAITVAARCEPALPGDNLLVHSVFQDDHGIRLGSRVTLTPESCADEPTRGELVSATRTHYTLRRTDERAGLVHVHFPRIGYVLDAADGAA